MANLDEAFNGPIMYINSIKNVINSCCDLTPVPNIKIDTIYSDTYTEDTIKALINSNDHQTNPWGTISDINQSVWGKFPK